MASGTPIVSIAQFLDVVKPVVNSVRVHLGVGTSCTADSLATRDSALVQFQLVKLSNPIMTLRTPACIISNMFDSSAARYGFDSQDEEEKEELDEEEKEELEAITGNKNPLEALPHLTRKGFILTRTKNEVDFYPFGQSSFPLAMCKTTFGGSKGRSARFNIKPNPNCTILRVQEYNATAR